MKHFLVLYIAPVASLEEWMKIPEEKRKSTEDALKVEWGTWLNTHADTVKNTVGLGQAKRVSVQGSIDGSAGGVTDVKNGFMLSSDVEAASLDDVAKLFADHPHLKIPGATIEIMETKSLGER